MLRVIVRLSNSIFRIIIIVIYSMFDNNRFCLKKEKKFILIVFHWLRFDYYWVDLFIKSKILIKQTSSLIVMISCIELEKSEPVFLSFQMIQTFCCCFYKHHHFSISILYFIIMNLSHTHIHKTYNHWLFCHYHQSKIQVSITNLSNRVCACVRELSFLNFIFFS